LIETQIQVVLAASMLMHMLNTYSNDCEILIQAAGQQGQPDVRM